MDALQQIKTELNDRQNARRRLIARALLAMRRFISARTKAMTAYRDRL
jgi:hypothetical protein